tara:strand:+ start:51380 stop:51580 length:201 start_codon:yes stop_codon:yes gene_type:complete
MNILLNNNKEEISDGITIDQLIKVKNVNNKYFAVEINEQVIPKSNYHKHVIKDGDVIEIITAIGGG